MKITNKTIFATADLRAIANEVAKRELTPERRKVVRVDFLRSRKYFTGVSYGRRNVVRIPPGPVADDWKIKLAVLIAHELHHASGNPGGRSNEYWMRRSVRYGDPRSAEQLEEQRQLYGWVLSMPVRLKADVPKRQSKPEKSAADRLQERRQKRLDKAQAAVKRWTIRLKTAQTKLKKLRQTIRRAERAMASAAAAPAVQGDG